MNDDVERATDPSDREGSDLAVLEPVVLLRPPQGIEEHTNGEGERDVVLADVLRFLVVVPLELHRRRRLPLYKQKM